MKLARTVVWNFPALIRSPIFLAMVAVLILWGIATYFIDPSSMLVTVNAVRLVFATSVAVAFLPAALVYIIQGSPPRQGYLVIGIFGSWAAEGMLGMVVLLRRLFEFPWWIPDYVIALLILFSAAFAVMHLTAKAIQEGETTVPKKEWIWTGVLAATGVGLAVFLMWAFSGGRFAEIGAAVAKAGMGM